MPRADWAQASKAMASAKAFGAISRRTVTATAAIATSIGSSGATATATVSAVAPPTKGVKRQLEPGDRQVDQPRPVDVGAAGGLSRYWRRSYQPWPVEQGADLHHPHIVVGVAEREPLDRGPARSQSSDGGGDQPEQQQPTSANGA